MTEKELLVVKDMSEDEQENWVCENACPDCDSNEKDCPSLADLAFRLRDEVDFNIYLEALEDVYKHWIEKQEERPCLVTFTCWLAVYITPIDRIIAALIAKESK